MNELVNSMENDLVREIDLNFNTATNTIICTILWYCAAGASGVSNGAFSWDMIIFTLYSYSCSIGTLCHFDFHHITIFECVYTSVQTQLLSAVRRIDWFAILAHTEYWYIHCPFLFRKLNPTDGFYDSEYYWIKKSFWETNHSQFDGYGFFWVPALFFTPTTNMFIDFQWNTSTRFIVVFFSFSTELSSIH